MAEETTDRTIRRLTRQIAKLKAEADCFFSAMAGRGARIERYHKLITAWRHQLPEEFVQQMDAEIDAWIEAESVKPKAQRSRRIT